MVDKKKTTTKKKAVAKDAKKKTEVKKIKKEEVKKPVKKNLPYIYKVGRRKNAVAQVRFYRKGEGKFEVNQKDYRQYFPQIEYQDTVFLPLKLVGEDKGHDITVLVRGGGKRGQADAIRLGIARALVEFNEEYKKSIKGVGYLTRDSRKKERKKPGLKRARRAPQWSKR